MHHIVKAVKPQYSWKLLFTNMPDDIKSKMDKDVEKALKRKQRKIRFKKWLGW